VERGPEPVLVLVEDDGRPFVGGLGTNPSRLDDEFAYDDGMRAHPHVLRSVLVREPAVTEYQVYQTADGAEILLRHETPEACTNPAPRITLASSAPTILSYSAEGNTPSRSGA
jgi:hypothetical protein